MKSVDITIVVTSHSEGVLLHKTLLSVNRAIKPLLDLSVSHEILLHLDNPTSSTLSYVETSSIVKNITVFKNTFRDAGSSRNFCIKRANGKYITFIDGDDLMSRNWLKEAYQLLEKYPYNEYVAHSEMTVEFGELASIVKKHGEINKKTDSLLSVWAGRWNSVIFAPTRLLKTMGYPSNRLGYGFEDWLMSCNFIAGNIHNILIPHTVIFVRRKPTDSMWSQHRESMSVLPSNKLLAFENIRKIPATWNGQVVSSPRQMNKLRLNAKSRLVGTPLEASGRRAYHLLKTMRNSIRQTNISVAYPEAWLINEWKSIHSIERGLFPSDDILKSIKMYDSITPEHYAVGEAYRQLIQHTKQNHYDYLLFVPWLIKGGADLFAINYANTIATLRPNKKVAVIATLPNVSSVRRHKLYKSIDFIPFGDIAKDLSLSCRNRLLEQFVENSLANCIHIFNSELAYSFVNTHREYISNTAKKVVVTSFSQSTDDTGRVFGYSHTHVPTVYELANVVTTDNQAVIDMWVNEYGFDSNKLVLHRQPVDLIKIEKGLARQTTPGNNIRVLWTSRIAPEKIPQLVPEIARLLQPYNITIDMYGTPDDGFDMSFLKNIPPNLTYRGSFDNFYKLNPQQYDIFLYTSLFDGMPNALLEASTVELPIVSSAIGGIPEFINNEQGGFLIENILEASDYADKIIKLAKDKEMRLSMARYSRNRLVEEFSISAHNAAIDSMLKKIDY